MKHLKTFEGKIELVKNTDLTGKWLPPKKDKNLVTKPVEFNEERGKKVNELLHKYDLCITDIGEYEWCSKHTTLLPDEKGLVEFRLTYGMLKDENHFYEEDDEYERYQNFDWDDFDIERDRDLINDDLGHIEHSVFLPANWKLSGDRLIYAALDWATDYLHKLTTFPEVIEGDTESPKFYDEPKKFVAWLETHNIKFTNKNLSDLPDIDYRLYKDSKFFAGLEEHVNIKNLFAEWLEIK